MAPIICCIDGNIGAGKSSVLNVLEQRGWRVFREDLSLWGWCLTKYYADPMRWGFTLQMAVLRSMMEHYNFIKQLRDPIVFIERSPASSMVFTRNSFNNGSLSRQELELVQAFHKEFAWAAHITIKLDTSPEKCYERVIERGRECERDMTIDYLEALHSEYKQIDAIKVDGLLSSEKIADIVENIINIQVV